MNVYDCRNLKRQLQFINSTITDERFVGADFLHEILSWIDAAHAIHPNMRGRTGGFIYFRAGVVHAISTKHKSNTRSTCISEMVGISEYLPFPIWLELYMGVLGYILNKNGAYEDN